MADPVPNKSPFDTLEAVFRLECAEPASLSVDGRQVPGLPARMLALDELRAILLHPSTPHATRDATLTLLLGRARAEGGAWTVGLAGVLLYGLRRAVAPLCAVCPDKRADIEAEALSGLIAGIAATKPGRPRLAARLTWLARNRAKRLVVTELAEDSRPHTAPAPAPPPRPFGHPDFVLAKAVVEGVLAPEDAALIGETRLGLMSFAEAASALEINVPAAQKRRKRAERILVDRLDGPDYEPGFVHLRPESPYLPSGGRPRLGRTTTGGRRLPTSPRTQGGEKRPSRSPAPVEGDPRQPSCSERRTPRHIETD